MDPDIITKAGFIVVGIRSMWNRDPALPCVIWRDAVFPRMHEIIPTRNMDKCAFTVFSRIPDDEDDNLEIVAGRMADSLENIPPGMVGWEVPDGIYAVAPAKSLEGVYAVYDAIASVWLPESGYRIGVSPSFAVASSFAGSDGLLGAEWRVHVALRNEDDEAELSFWE